MPHVVTCDDCALFPSISMLRSFGFGGFFRDIFFDSDKRSYHKTANVQSHEVTRRLFANFKGIFLTPEFSRCWPKAIHCKPRPASEPPESYVCLYSNGTQHAAVTATDS